MNCKPLRTLIALNIALACSLTASAASLASPATAPPEARAAAELGLHDWINEYIKDGVQPGQDFVLDIETLEQLKAAHLGRGLAMKIVDPGQLTAGSTLRQASHGNGQWRFIVMVNDDAVGLADVRQTADGYRMIGLGAKELARSIEDRLVLHPGRSASLVRSHQARADYLELVADNGLDVLYAPLLAGATTTRDNEDAPVEHPVTDAANQIEETALAAELRDAIAYDAEHHTGEAEE